MFNRQNIVDEHDLREAVTRPAHYIDSLPSTPNVVHLHAGRAWPPTEKPQARPRAPLLSGGPSDSGGLSEAFSREVPPQRSMLLLRSAPKNKKHQGLREIFPKPLISWLRGLDLNQRPLGYETVTPTGTPR